MIRNSLKDVRLKEYGMTQREFAELLGITPVKYNLYEKGRFAPQLETALEMARKLDKSIHDIFYLL